MQDDQNKDEPKFELNFKPLPNGERYGEHCVVPVHNGVVSIIEGALRFDHDAFDVFRSALGGLAAAYGAYCYRCDTGHEEAMTRWHDDMHGLFEGMTIAAREGAQEELEEHLRDAKPAGNA